VCSPLSLSLSLSLSLGLTVDGSGAHRSDSDNIGLWSSTDRVWICPLLLSHPLSLGLSVGRLGYDGVCSCAMGYQCDGPMWSLGWCGASWHVKSIPAVFSSSCLLQCRAAASYNGLLINGTHQNYFLLYGQLVFHSISFSLSFYFSCSICISFSI
jgi:hypothetical protein